MPAVSAAQLRAAYAAANRGEGWGKKMVAHTPKTTQSRLLKGTKPQSKKKNKKRRKKYG